MANYEARARTNYFHVKALDTFTAWAEERRLTIIIDDDGRVGLIASDDSGWPTTLLDAKHDVDVDIATELAAQLADGAVAILVEVGSEKHCYLTAVATAINSRGEYRTIDLLSAIQQESRALSDDPGAVITAPEY